MANPVNWFQIQAKDGASLAEFYGKAFDWKIQTSPGGMSMVDRGSKDGIPGGIASTQDGSDKGVAIYVDVANLEAHLARIEAAGGKPVMPPMELPNNMGRIAGFLDPAGNWIGLWQAPPKAPTAKRRAPAKKTAAKKPAPAKKTAAPAKKTAAKKTTKKR